MTKLRQSNIEKLSDGIYDVLVVGGGINGAVSAAALSAKGARVALIDKGDFAGFTSSNSSNLAWGGIKYLESHEYALVNKLCKSRNHLMQSYPSTVKEIRFFTSIQKGFRFPAFLVFLGTIVYWLIGRLFTKMPVYLTLKTIKALEPVVNTANVTGGFEYSDCYLYDNDARFVFNFIRSSMSYGCIAANYVELISSEKKDGLWLSHIKDTQTGKTSTITSRAFINAAGPFVDAVNEINTQKSKHRHVFSKGIHLIVEKITDSQKVLTFFADDGRLFFVIPMGTRTCIGTTDDQVDKPESYVTDEDREFVLTNVNKLLELESPVTIKDIIAERCGVRPLAVESEDGGADHDGADRDDKEKADWVKLSRKHAIDVDTDNKYLSIFGGKLTDCINVGDEIAEIIASLGIELSFPDFTWYGEPDDSVKAEFMHRARLMNLDALTPECSSEHLSQRFWRRYGRNAINMLEQIRENPAMGELLIENSEYLRVEIYHAAAREMVTKLEDFLRRRSKISLVLRKEDIIASKGLNEACEILFADEAESKLQEYINNTSQN